MRYLGGKSRLSKQIIEIIHQECPDHKLFIEPFCGAVNITTQASKYYTVYASDNSEDMILLWNHVKNEGDNFKPVKITKEEYYLLKVAKPSWKRAIAGFGYAYRGVWFSGYDPGTQERDVSMECYRSIIKKLEQIKNVSFECKDYQVHNPLIEKGNCIIYCDPPYARTSQKYSAGEQFNSEQFWTTIKKWKSWGNEIYVSEYNCPIDHEIVLKKKLVNSLNSTKIATEKLFYIL